MASRVPKEYADTRSREIAELFTRTATLLRGAVIAKERAIFENALCIPGFELRMMAMHLPDYIQYTQDMLHYKSRRGRSDVYFAVQGVEVSLEACLHGLKISREPEELKMARCIEPVLRFLHELAWDEYCRV